MTFVSWLRCFEAWFPAGPAYVAGNARAPLFMVLTAMSWAWAFPAIKAALVDFSPLEVAAVRVWLAALVLFPFAWREGIRWPRGKEVGSFVVAAALAFPIYFGVLNTGMQYVSAGVSGTMMALIPLVTGIIARYRLGEHASGWVWVGFAVSTAGIVTISFGPGVQGDSGLFGLALILVAILAQSVFMTTQKRMVGGRTGLSVVFLLMAYASVMFVPVAPGIVMRWETLPFEAWRALFVLGLVPTALGYLFMAITMRYATATLSAAAIYLVPGFAFVTSHLWLHDVPVLLDYVGAGLCVAGVVLANTMGRRTAEPSPSTRAASP